MANKKGRIELADRGTLFLDEIGEMPMELQVKLLRSCSREKSRRSARRSRREVDIRIVAATHRDLKVMIEDGTFREDLYYRLAVIPLVLPPLRERAADIRISCNISFCAPKSEWVARAQSFRRH